MQLRPDQIELKNKIYEYWNKGYRNVGASAPTGFGKTVLFSNIMKDFKYPIGIVHRKEIVDQMSVTLARNNIYHEVWAPEAVVNNIIKIHIGLFKKSFIKYNTNVAIGGVRTILSRYNELQNKLNRSDLWICDEAHHLLKENEWGKCISLIPNALGLCPSATFIRSDKKGLGREYDGLIDVLAYGPSLRQLINAGNLCEFKIYSPDPGDLNLDDVTISSTTGDYNQQQLIVKTKESQKIIGDVVNRYKEFADNKRGITFCVDIEEAHRTADAFNKEGVKAVAISSKTLMAERFKLIQEFKNDRIKQLVNVDLFGEGFDVPGVEVVSMVRATESYSLYLQQIGRALRTAEGKKEGVIIDHVGNSIRMALVHGRPDDFKQWSLEPFDKKKKKIKSSNSYKTCKGCTQLYQVYLKVCPHCGYFHTPKDRTKPEHVDGDLQELDFNIIEQIKNDINKIKQPASQLRNHLLQTGMGIVQASSIAKAHGIRQETHNELLNTIQEWAGVEHHGKGLNKPEIQRLFFHLFNVDILTAQTLPTNQARKLKKSIDEHLQSSYTEINKNKDRS